MSKRHAFVFSDKLSERLENFAEDIGLSKSEIVRRAVAEHLHGIQNNEESNEYSNERGTLNV